MLPLGIIRTALPNMDREVKEQYQVLIQAKDMGGQLGGLAGTTTINITLSDVNDNPPRFSKSFFHLRVPESSPVGSAVGRIKAHDLDIGKNAEVEYNIVPGDGGNMFDIITNEHNQEGIIILKRGWCWCCGWHRENLGWYLCWGRDWTSCRDRDWRQGVGAGSGAEDRENGNWELRLLQVGRDLGL
ncbi:unnamed protein product [Coregonus sp. 'balchen']|nr:unnamed protein product [Coregonus sp. 'balchen']